MELEKVSRDYASLYQQEDSSPLGRLIPIHVSPFQIDDGLLTKAKFDTSVHCLGVNRVGGHTQLWGEHFKSWLREAYPVKEATTPPKPVKWWKLVDLVQFVWELRTIPADMGWES